LFGCYLKYPRAYGTSFLKRVVIHRVHARHISYQFEVNVFMLIALIYNPLKYAGTDAESRTDKQSYISTEDHVQLLYNKVIYTFSNLNIKQ
jgi:hypothetical protein